MALPKRRTPKAKRNSRRSHDRVAVPTLVRDPATGGFKVNHTAGGSRDRKGRIIQRDED
ncbi:MAG: 50S ribosomal protein L32 [Chloroflexi bacterium]|jgi:large subunit ribosomal protein L32|nr:50S ribosomal protein L32 [Chloroflexota bacterium]MDA1240111.1 50S ribosomal protein L32 [Chloroflexota bacterium]MQC25391.1 50S ribosomal protein L32 [Chloroflexota bacterium]MQC48204.1 50S ribosomal protein L32 [Chloroflexota bacterium]